MVLGRFLGFGSQRPEMSFGTGPDNLWAVGGQVYFVIECKNSAVTDKISKHDSDQLSGSMNWFSKQYDKTCKATPVMIHPSHTFIKQASPPEHTLIIDSNCMAQLNAALINFAIAAGKNKAFIDAKKIGELLNHFRLIPKEFLKHYSTAFKKEN